MFLLSVFQVHRVTSVIYTEDHMWAIGDVVAQWVKSTGWYQAVTQKSRVRSWLPPQSPGGEQESWLCNINKISGNEASLPE
jgi:hypothetical protein